MRIFLAGASGVIGVRLIPLLVANGHVVGGMTRSPNKVKGLEQLGAEPIVCDVYDARTLFNAVKTFRPELLMHQLTDLPDSADQIPYMPSGTTASAPREPATCWPLASRRALPDSSRNALRGRRLLAAKPCKSMNEWSSTPAES
jgi:hypothetical protein